MSEEKTETKDFIIKDRRFSAQEAKEKEGDEQRNRQREEPEAAEAKTKEPEQAPAEETGLPEINFMTFIMSLNASAFYHLGLIEDPTTGKKIKNLALGKQTIDILGMLEEKTRGNLTKEEENMLKNIIYDLRIIYVKEKS